ncbi:MAG: hypothetical protein F6J92_21930 [Symploca sp. SIO1A3]|nr:hypothetical protein [Symploca sp. SIO1A3]
MQEYSKEKLQILDTRPCAQQRIFYLEGIERLVYLACDRALTSRELLRVLTKKYQLSLSWDDVKPVINSLKQKLILAELSGRFLSLAVGGLVPPLPSSADSPSGNVLPTCQEGEG